MILVPQLVLDVLGGLLLIKRDRVRALVWRQEIVQHSIGHHVRQLSTAAATLDAKVLANVGRDVVDFFPCQLANQFVIQVRALNLAALFLKLGNPLLGIRLGRGWHLAHLFQALQRPSFLAVNCGLRGAFGGLQCGQLFIANNHITALNRR